MNKYLIKVQNYFPLLAQVCRFGIVGLIAAAIHFSIVVTLVQQYHFLPLIANVYGFLIAFQMSYWGHRFFTFQDTQTLHRVALPKLLIVQILNFAANETLFYIFLSLHLSYTVALFIVLSVLPLFTYLSSKLWVFR